VTTKWSVFFGDYALELEMKQHIVSRTSARTADRKAVKTVDESYNEYTFTIRTDVEPWSEYLEKQAAKRAKRDAKGRKKKTVDEMM
jgi:23S rRNA maturation mini-RNase III